MKKAILVIGAVTIAFMLGMQVLVMLNVKEVEPPDKSLAEVLPEEAGYWQVISDELGREDFANERVRAILQYDDTIVRTYTNGEQYFQVYLAYWKPGTAPYNRVGTHNPDTCWVNAGMERLDRAQLTDLKVNGQPLKTAEYGKYLDPRGREVSVVFWHLVGDGLYSYEGVGWDASIWGKIKRGLLVFDDFRRFGFDQRQQQYFVRVSSNTDLAGTEKTWNHEILQDIMNDVLQDIPLATEAGDGKATTASAETSAAVTAL
ncbi:MAG: exosortase-associated EpsI family protein [Opitutales bacterium]